MGQLAKEEDQRDLMDFLRNEGTVNINSEQKTTWSNPTPLEPVLLQPASDTWGKRMKVGKRNFSGARKVAVTF